MIAKRQRRLSDVDAVLISLFVKGLPTLAERMDVLIAIEREGERWVVHQRRVWVGYSVGNHHVVGGDVEIYDHGCKTLPRGGRLGVFVVEPLILLAVGMSLLRV